MLQVCFSFFSHGIFREVLSRKSTILLTIYCDKHWDMLLVVLLMWIWQGKGGLDILWKMKGNTLPPRRPSEISELIGTVCPLLKANLCLFSLLSVPFPRSLRSHAEPVNISGEYTCMCQHHEVLSRVSQLLGLFAPFSKLLQNPACSAPEWIILGHPFEKAMQTLEFKIPHLWMRAPLLFREKTFEFGSP